MKHWPLRVKVAAWSALLAAAVLLVSVVGTVLFVWQEQVEALDEQMANEAHTFFGEVARQGTGPDWQNPMVAKQLLPLTSSPRFVEVYYAGQPLPVLHSGAFTPGQFAAYPAGMHTVEVNGENTRLGVFVNGPMRFCLAIALSEIRGDSWQVRLAGLVAVGICVSLIALGSWLLAGHALAPLRHLTEAVEQITAQRLASQVPPVAGTDEVARLGHALHQAVNRLDTSFQQASRFTADASHELKTPLAVMHAAAESLLESPTLAPGDRREVSVLQEQVARLTSITQSLLLLSRVDAGHLSLEVTALNLTEPIALALEDAAVLAEEKQVRLESEYPAALPAYADAGRTVQILLNLLANAVRYNRSGGLVSLHAVVEGGGICVSIANTGPGIPPEEQPQLFQRFYRGHQQSQEPGHGLGLSLARELARAQGGEVWLAQSEPDCTTFCARFRHAAEGGVMPR